MFCRWQLSQLRRQSQRVEGLQAHGVALFPMEAAALREWWPEGGSRIRVAGDPAREVFRRYGVGRLPWTRLITGRVLREGWRARREADLPGRGGGDPLGQPALYVIGRSRRIGFVHMGTDMADRPDWERVFRELAKG